MSIQIQEMTKYDIINASLPNHNSSYTVIPHREVIDNTINLLKASGFKVTEERYRANLDCQEAQGIYYIVPDSNDTEIKEEEELGMMFAWTNSYNKCFPGPNTPSSFPPLKRIVPDNLSRNFNETIIGCKVEI